MTQLTVTCCPVSALGPSADAGRDEVGQINIRHGQQRGGGIKSAAMTVSVTVLFPVCSPSSTPVTVNVAPRLIQRKINGGRECDCRIR